jgi:nitrile hydratase accessory protein
LILADDTTIHKKDSKLLISVDASEERVFTEPWQAQAFAMVVTLTDRGYFTWKEWTETFSGVLAESKNEGGVSDGGDYYPSWVKALERMVFEKGITDLSNLDATKVAWETAYKATPHGHPVHLRGR